MVQAPPWWTMSPNSAGLLFQRTLTSLFGLRRVIARNGNRTRSSPPYLHRAKPSSRRAGDRPGSAGQIHDGAQQDVTIRGSLCTRPDSTE